MTTETPWRQRVDARAPSPAAADPARPSWRRDPPPADARRVISVAELTHAIRQRLEPAFTRVLVRGEIAGFRGATARGHWYFKLKDASASIDVCVWQSTARTLRFQPKDGLSVILEGELNVYAQAGTYSLIAAKVEPEGVGAKALALEQLKAKLAQAGLLGPTRTKPRLPLPALPRRIGVATSVTGAALRDFLKIVHRRHPTVSVLVCDARVQGDGAGWDVARAVRWLAVQPVDVIVVTRGGGSADDLWTFNEEPVARAIFESRIPVVSAVGHEIDVTLADLVADVRAPTPSAAAELVVPVVAELTQHLLTLRNRLRRAVERRVVDRRRQLDALRAGLQAPARRLVHRRLHLADLAERLNRAERTRLRGAQEGLRRLSARLGRLSPGAQLAARQARLDRLRQGLREAPRARLGAERAALAALRHRLWLCAPHTALAQARASLDALARRLATAQRTQLDAARARQTTAAVKLDAYSPLKVLGRGYAIARTEDGVVRSVEQVGLGARVTVRVADGELDARVEQTRRLDDAADSPRRR